MFQCPGSHFQAEHGDLGKKQWVFFVLNKTGAYFSAKRGLAAKKDAWRDCLLWLFKFSCCPSSAGRMASSCLVRSIILLYGVSVATFVRFAVGSRDIRMCGDTDMSVVLAPLRG